MINKEFNSFKKKTIERNQFPEQNSFFSDSKNSDLSVNSVISEIDDLNKESDQISLSKSRKQALQIPKKRQKYCETPEKLSKLNIQSDKKLGQLDFDEKSLDHGHFQPRVASRGRFDTFKSGNNQTTPDNFDGGKLCLSNSFPIQSKETLLEKKNDNNSSSQKNPFGPVDFGSSCNQISREILENEHVHVLHPSSSILTFNKPKIPKEARLSRHVIHRESSTNSADADEATSKKGQLATLLMRFLRKVFAFLKEFFKFIGVFGTILYIGLILVLVITPLQNLDKTNS